MEEMRWVFKSICSFITESIISLNLKTFLRDEILKLREAGESNDTILEKVIEKNKNFESKFRLTQEKFIQAKQKKHGGR